MTTQTAKRLAETLYQDDMSRADEVPVERDGHRAYDGWVRASATAGDRDTAEALEHVDRDEFAAAWDALASGGGVMTTHRYAVHNMAGGMEHSTDDLEEAVLHALDRCPVGPGYVVDGTTGERVDLSHWEVETDDDGNAYLEAR